MAKSDQIWQIPTISNYRSGQGQNGIYTHVCYVLFMILSIGPTSISELVLNPSIHEY